MKNKTKPHIKKEEQRMSPEVVFEARKEIAKVKISETMRYLFEKEGEVTIPEMVFSWYNPYQEKLYKRTLKEFTIEVQPNPDLGILASI